MKIFPLALQQKLKPLNRARPVIEEQVAIQPAASLSGNPNRYRTDRSVFSDQNDVIFFHGKTRMQMNYKTDFSFYTKI